MNTDYLFCSQQLSVTSVLSACYTILDVVLQKLHFKILVINSAFLILNDYIYNPILLNQLS